MARTEREAMKCTAFTFSNCLIFALCAVFTRSGYIVARKSRHGWWAHFLWTKDLRHFEEFVPDAHTPGLVSAPPLFRGHVKKSTGGRP